MERLRAVPSNTNIRLLDWCFDIDQAISNDMAVTCPYNTAGGDLICVKPIEETELVGSVNVKEIATAAVVKHL